MFASSREGQIDAWKGGGFLEQYLLSQLEGMGYPARAYWGLGSVSFIAGVGKPQFWNQIQSTACFCNKVLLEHSHAQLFRYCLWLLSNCSSRGE